MNTIREDDHYKERTFIFSTNNLKLVEFCDKVIFMEKGKIAFFGTPEQLKDTFEYKEMMISAQKERESRV